MTTTPFKCDKHNPYYYPCAQCLLENGTCVICDVQATQLFYGKTLCDYHYELSRH